MTKNDPKTNTPTLQDEFILLEEVYPGFAAVLLPPIEEGRIDGVYYKLDSIHYADCGCAYGQLAHFDVDEAMVLARKIRRLLSHQYGIPFLCPTPMEELVEDVQPNDTPLNNPDLATLHTALVQHQHSIKQEVPAHD